MQSRNDLAADLAALAGESAELTIRDAAGTPVSVLVQRSSFPSIAGPIAKAELALLTAEEDINSPGEAQIASPRGEAESRSSVSEKFGPTADEPSHP